MSNQTRCGLNSERDILKLHDMGRNSKFKCRKEENLAQETFN